MESTSMFGRMLGVDDRVEARGALTQSCEPLINCRRAAQILGVHPKTVKVMAARGRIPGLKIGSVWRFRESALDAWVNAQLKSCPPLAAADNRLVEGQ